MHSFLHGIRRSSCWPVASPLAFARLTCPLPFTLLKQPCGYGDLLQSGEADQEGDLLPSGDEDDEGDLLPYSGDEADGEGPLPPSQGDEQDDGEGFLQPSHGDDDVLYGLLLAYQSGEPTDFRFSTKVHEGKPCVEEGILLPAAHVKPMLSSTKFRRLLSSTLYVFDPGGFSSHLGEAPSACHPTWTTLSTFLANHAGATLLTNRQHADTSVNAHIHVGQMQVLQVLVGGNQSCFRLDDKSHLAGLSYGEAHCRFSEVQCKVLLLMELLQEDAAPYDCSLWLNSSNSKKGADAYFLIPLRGSNSVQWNDEDFDEDVAALKMMTKRRMMVLWLLYLMKDLLDPG